MDLAELLGLTPGQIPEGVPGQASNYAGAAATPNQTATPTSGPWQDFLSSPQNRAGLLQASLSLMVPQWGNPVSNLGVALSRGAEAASGVTANQQEQAAKQAELQNRKDVAQIGASSREEAAQIRAEAMIQRSQMNLNQKASAVNALKYRTEARKIVEADPKNMRLDNTERSLLIEQMANSMYDADASRGTLLGPTQASGATSTGTPAAGGPVGPSGAAKAGNATSTSLDKLMKDPKMGAQFSRDLQTPEGQAKILQVNPELKPYVDEYNRRNAPLEGSALGNLYTGAVEGIKGAARESLPARLYRGQ